MNRGLQGEYVSLSIADEAVRAFVPTPLPPHPPLEWPPARHNRFDQALLALGRLDGVVALLPNSALFLPMFIRREAVLSSLIEGGRTSLENLLLFELKQMPGVPLDDVRRVANYATALDHGLRRLSEGLPLSMRLFREIQGILCQTGPDHHQGLGEFRRSPHWVGGTRPGNAVFVPPPAEEVLECMRSLNLFLHDQPTPTPMLLKIGLVQAQLAMIQPFGEDNGRLERLLITLLLHAYKVLAKPLFCPSLYFQTHRRLYDDLRDRVRLTGEWEAWLDFFAEAVCTTARHTLETLQQVLALMQQDRARIAGLGRPAVSTLRIYEALLAQPVASSGWLVAETRLTPATVNKSLRHLERFGIILEITSQKRNRLFSYAAYMALMQRGMQ
jgi:Fic family protein